MIRKIQLAQAAPSPQFCHPDSGVLAQLVERLNGIEEVRGSNPLGSTIRRWVVWDEILKAVLTPLEGHLTAGILS